MNNWDLLRLFAASQVAVIHGASHLNYYSPALEVLKAIPGVPVFFFISGFLIYGSYESSLKGAAPLRNFYSKRCLRLYPALWCCFVASLVMVALTGYFSSVDIDPLVATFWFLCQTTVFQFFNPEFMRSFGVGALNGALWTVAVEIQFYILFPLIYRLVRSKFCLLIIALFCAANLAHANYNDAQTIVTKLFAVSFVPWLYMFMLGAICARHKERVVEACNQVSIIWPIATVSLVYLLSLELELTWGNRIHPIGYLVVVWLAVQCAFKAPDLSERVLSKNDISYGIYIWHMPIINVLLHQYGTGGLKFLIAMTITVLIAYSSWRWVERPALRMKTFQLRSV